MYLAAGKTIGDTITCLGKIPGATTFYLTRDSAMIIQVISFSDMFSQ